MNTGAYAYLLHRISPHVVQVEMRNMNHKEVVAAYPEWLEGTLAHTQPLPLLTLD